MPLCWPAAPHFVNATEREVWEALRDQLDDDDLLIANLRLVDLDREYELDIVVVFKDAGVVIVEVKGGSVWVENGTWRQAQAVGDKEIFPVEQASKGKYALRDYIDNSMEWAGRQPIRWSHAVCFPGATIDPGFAMPDCKRWMVIDRGDMPSIASKLRNIPLIHGTHQRVVNGNDIVAIHDALAGRMLPQRNAIDEAMQHEKFSDRLTQEQAVILDAIRLLPRVEVRGGAGSGKTWLAMEQARRLTREGKRVALICYSRGLAAWMKRRADTFDRKQRPAYVGTFHGLGQLWGAPEGSDDDSAFWETELPEQMVALGHAQSIGQRFDAIIIDEAQDFAESWWPAVFAALKHDDSGLYVFSDEGQQVFARFSGGPADLVPLVLDQNLRNTKQISETFSTMTPIRMRSSSIDGPQVRFVACGSEEALDRADDQIDPLLDEGWSPADITILATGSRHPEQTARQEDGQDRYWDSFWDDQQVFYGHVLGFKGLERNVVVLAINSATGISRAKERLYVGLSRARELLIVCGDPADIEAVGGPAVRRKLGG